MTDEQLIEIIKRHLIWKKSETVLNPKDNSTFEPILSAMREAVEKESIGFADWIEEYEHILGDNWGGGSFSKPAKDLYINYKEYLSSIKSNEK